jgi:hypothetical protein
MAKKVLQPFSIKVETDNKQRFAERLDKSQNSD